MSMQIQDWKGPNVEPLPISPEVSRLLRTLLYVLKKFKVGSPLARRSVTCPLPAKSSDSMSEL